MSPVSKAISNRNKQIVIGVAVVAAGLWIMLVMYVLSESQKDYSVAQPGAVAVHAPSPSGGMPSATHYIPHHSTSFVQSGSTVSHQWSYVDNMPQASMPNASMRVYQTSNATVNFVGGGGNAGGIAMTSGGGNAGRGVRYTAVAYSGSIYVPRSNNAVTEVGAGSANEVANTTSTQAATPGRIRRVNDNPLEPFPDPIGEVVWGLMAILATGYAVYVRRRMKRLPTKPAGGSSR